MSKAFQIFKASAGSGKTFTLVIKYLEIILSSQDQSKFKQILAITFTNKAAAEMKERIISFLSELAQKSEKSKQLLNILAPKLNLTDDEICKRAQQALSEILHHYSDFSVTTIDKFVQKVVRSFSKELNLPYNYVVELDQEEILNEAIQRILSKIGQNAKLTDALLKLVMNQLNSDKKWKVNELLFETGQQIFKEQNEAYIPSITNIDEEKLDGYIKYIEVYLKQKSDAIRVLAKETIDYIRKNGFDENDFFQTRSGVYKYFLNASAYENSYIGMNSYVKKAYQDEQWQSKNPRSVLDDNTKQYLLKNLREIAAFIEDKNIYTYTSILKNVYLFKIIRELNIEVDQIQHQSEKIHISNFNKRIGEIVKNEPIPFIYERMGNKYKHLMIDEFQDTSILQWDNMLPLIENGLSEGKYSLIVGDPKQAIYRWRGGESKQFIELPYPIIKENNERYQSLIYNHELVNLSKNYRSDKEIIEFNNLLYNYVIGIDNQIAEVFKGHEQEINEKSYGGAVVVQIIDRNDYQELIFTQLLNDIYELTNVKKFQMGDIAILVRKNADAALIAEFLLNNEINVVTTDGLQLVHNENCNAVVSWLNFLNNTNDLVAKASILFDLKDRELLLGAHNWIIDEKHLKDFDLNQVFQTENIDQLIFKPLSFVTETILRILKIYPSNDIAVMTFLDMVYQFENKNSSSIGSFLNYWNTKGFKKKIESAESNDSVQIMTIHKSKGLQFPVVLLPFIQDNRRGINSFKWFELNDEKLEDLKYVFISLNKELEYSHFSEQFLEDKFMSFIDDLCLLYVATTRPENALYIYLKSIQIEKIKKEDELAVPLNQLLIEYLELNKSMFDKPHETTYIFGNESFTQKKTHVVIQHQSNKTETNEVFTKRLNIIERKVDVLSEIGNVFHQIMEKCDTYSMALLEINSYQYLSENDSLFLTNYIESIFKHEQLSKWLTNKQAFSERDLIKNGEILRPDKVIFEADKIIVIDFKTGSESEKHVTQIKAYAEAMETIENKPTESYITYYNDGLKIVKI